MSSFLLRALVTFTGACVLVVEVLATRILAPHFGSSLYTLSSVLGVTLGALSVGYYIGGIIADKHPSWRTLGILIVLSGVTTILIWPFSLSVLPALGRSLSGGSGPLVGSILLFLVPCGILGMFSPYAVALEARFIPGHAAGRAAGNIFFWSTLGSIAGSIAAGFTLIPLLGIKLLIAAIGLSLLTVGAVMMLLTMKKGRGIGFLISCLFLASSALSVPERSQAVYAVDGVYQRITVQDVAMDIAGNNLRVLWQDRNASSAVHLEDDELAFDYMRPVAAAWTGREPPRRSLVIGAGAFIVPGYIAKTLPDAEVDVVDIEPGLEDIATRFFRYEPTPRVRSIIADGRTHVRDSKPYDLIMGDAYQATHSIPPHLTTQEFFALVKDHLTDEGMFIGNFIGSIETSKKTYLPAAMKTLLSVFPEGRFYGIQNPEGFAVQNVIFIACKSDACIDPCSQAFKRSPDPVVSTLCEREVKVNAADLAMHPLLTDDYAPVEWLAAGQ